MSRHRKQGRDIATLFFMVGVLVTAGLSGCARISNVVVGGGTGSQETSAKALAARAADIPYASIDVRVDGTGGLIVLSEQAGRFTYWQSGQKQTLVFRDGRLAQTTGLPGNLLFSRHTQEWETTSQAQTDADTDIRYQVTRVWETSTGVYQALAGDARLQCDQHKLAVDLPLATLPLQRCRETVAWNSGASTASVFWRDMQTHRIWAAESVPWPGGPAINWRVARPWW